MRLAVTWGTVTTALALFATTAAIVRTWGAVFALLLSLRALALRAAFRFLLGGFGGGLGGLRGRSYFGRWRFCFGRGCFYRWHFGGRDHFGLDIVRHSGFLYASADNLAHSSATRPAGRNFTVMALRPIKSAIRAVRAFW